MNNIDFLMNSEMNEKFYLSQSPQINRSKQIKEYLSQSTQRSQRKYLFSFIAERPINETLMPFGNVKSVVDA